MNPELAKKLYRLQEVMWGFEWEKDGINRRQEYKYITESQYKENFKKALKEVGLLWQMEAVDGEVIMEITDKMHLVYCRFIGRIIDPETGETAEYRFHGTGADVGDKGYYKAATGALKYFLATNFNIAEHNDPEIETSVLPASNRPATPEKRTEVRDKLTGKDAEANELQLTALKRLLKEHGDKKLEAQIKERTKDFTELTSGQCEALVLQIRKLTEGKK